LKEKRVNLFLMKSNGAYQRVPHGTNSDSDLNGTTATPIVVSGTVNSNQLTTTTSTSTGNHRNSTGTYSVLRPSPTLYRTKCDLNTIPLVARNMTWADSFYENFNYDTDEIIAVFDIDWTVYDYKGGTQLLYVSLFIFCTLFFGLLFLIVAIIIVLIIENKRRSNMFRLQRTHIAITHNGIHLDEVDVPGSTNLMCHAFIKFSNVKQCNGITEYGWTEQSTSHKILLLTKELSTARDIVGIKQQQKFVDIVNAMMVQTTTETVAELV
jgi:hypothetical protein